MPRGYWFLFCLVSFICLQSWQANQNTAQKKGYKNKEKQTRKEEITLLDFPIEHGVFKQYFLKNVRYPSDARENKIQGIVLVRFLVNVDGSISKVKVLRDIGGGCSKEVIRVINSTPQWNLRHTAGKALPTVFMLKTQFTIIE